jgi:hypothetical protein
MAEKNEDVAQMTIQFRYPPDFEMEVEGLSADGDTGMTVILTFLAMRNMEMMAEFLPSTNLKSCRWDDVEMTLTTKINGEAMPVDFNEVRDKWNKVMGGNVQPFFEPVAEDEERED